MKNWAFWARVIVSIAALVLLLWWVDWNEFADTLKAANGYWIFIVFVINHVDRLFMVYKWMMLLRGSGVSISTITAFKSYYVGAFWGSILPLSVAGDLTRISWLMKNVQGSAIIASSVVIERLLGTLAQVIAALGSFILLVAYFDLNLSALFSIIFLLLFVSIAAVTALFSQFAHDIVQKLMSRLPFERVSRVVEKVRVATLTFKERPGLLIAFLILSILKQAFPISSLLIMAKAFSIDLSLIWAIIGVPITLVVDKMPISVKGFGVQEGTFAFIFSFAGVPLTKSVMICVVDRVLTLLATLPGALWTASVSKHKVSTPDFLQDYKPME